MRRRRFTKKDVDLKKLEVGKKKRNRSKSQQDENQLIEDAKKQREAKKNLDFKEGGFGYDEAAQDYKSPAVDEVLTKRRAKKKKGKEKLEAIIASYNRSSKKNMSLMQKNFNEMAKLGYKTINDVTSFFTTRNVSLGTLSKKMYEALLKTKVDNLGCIRLSDTLANDPLYEYLFVDGFDTRLITNDRLWLNLLYYRSIKSRMEGEDKYTLELLRDSTISKVTVVSKPLIFNGQDKMYRGYYQDFSGDFAVIGVELLNAEQQKITLDWKIWQIF